MANLHYNFMTNLCFFFGKKDPQKVSFICLTNKQLNSIDNVLVNNRSYGFLTVKQLLRFNV